MVPAKSEARHLSLLVRTKQSRWMLLAAAMVALSACETLGVEQNQSELTKEAIDPIRQSLASAGAVADAERALDEEDYERAYSILRQYLALNPSDDKAKLLLARTYIGRNQGRNAETILDALSDKAKDTAQAEMLRGLASLVIGEHDAAHTHLEAALDRDPTMWRAANGLGLLYDFEGKWKESEASYKRALEQKPDAAIVHNNLGYSYLLQGRVEEATEEFTTSLSYAPKLAVARANLRLALAAKGRYTDAVAGVDRANLPQVLNNIGFVAMVLGDYESAEIFFNRAIAESPVYYDTAQENLKRLQALVEQPADQRPTRTIGRSLVN